MARHYLVTALFLLALAPAGCQRMRFDKKYTIEPSTLLPLELDAPRYDQKLKIEITSPGAAVSAYLVKTAGRQPAEQAVENDKAPADALGGQSQAETISFEATVPAGTAPSLLIHNSTGKTAEVQVRITGR